MYGEAIEAHARYLHGQLTSTLSRGWLSNSKRRLCDLQDYGSMTEAEAAHAAHDILQVLAECHRQGICYADVKPANFLLKRPYSRQAHSSSDSNTPSRVLEIRVGDFGCSQRLQKVCFAHHTVSHSVSVHSIVFHEAFMNYTFTLQLSNKVPNVCVDSFTEGEA